METIHFLGIFLFSSAILFLYFWLILRNRNFHRFNRFYLLGNLILPILIPFLNFNLRILPHSEHIPKTNFINLPVQDLSPNLNQEIPWETLIIGLSAGISFILIIRLAIGIRKIFKLGRPINNDRKTGYTLIHLESNQAPFSFLEGIYWPQNLSLEDRDGKRIFQHELCHIREKHTYDKLFTQVMLGIFWMNPFYYLIDKELSLIHEFIADEVSFPERDVQTFAQCLLRVQGHFQNLVYTQSFFQSPLKRRFQIMKNPKSTKFSFLRKFIPLPLSLLLILGFSLGEIKGSNPKILDKVLEKETPKTSDPTDTVKKIKLKVKKVNGKIVEIKRVSQSVDGKDSIVMVTYIEDKKGKKTSKSKDSTLTVTYHEDRKGKGNYKRDSDQYKIVVNDTVVTNVTQTEKVPDRKIYIINDKEVQLKDFKVLSPDKIQEVRVFKGDEAVKKYGERGREGVIVIITKDAPH